MRVAVVIPALDESATIGAVVSAAAKYGSVIVVDDGSTDDTAVAARAAGASVVSHGQNRGYDAALASGMAEAAHVGADVVVTIDADGQHEPSRLSAVLEPLQTGRAGLVLGVRAQAARRSERLFNLYTRLRFDVPDILCGVKGYSIDVYRAHRRAAERKSIGTGLALAALRAGVPHETVAIPIAPRRSATRFGAGLRADLRILRALGDAVAVDVSRRS